VVEKGSTVPSHVFFPGAMTHKPPKINRDPGTLANQDFMVHVIYLLISWLRGVNLKATFFASHFALGRLRQNLYVT